MRSMLATTEDVAIRAAYEANGKVTDIAEMLGVSRTTVYDYRNRWPEFDEAIEIARQMYREEMFDLAESGMHEALMDQRAWAIQYYLNTQGRWAGYGTHASLDVNADVRSSHLIEEKSKEWDRILREWKAEGTEADEARYKGLAVVGHE